MPSYKLTYFNFSGLGEGIRYIFAYAGQPYEDVRINSEDWPKLKPTTPFGKMPTLEIDGKVVSQSNAIARYLARQFGFAGKDDWEALQIDSLVDSLVDLRTSLISLFFENDEQKKKDHKKKLEEETIPFYFEKFNDIVANNPSGVLVGSEITWADLLFAPILRSIEQYHPGSLEQYPALRQLIDKVENIPRIKTWLETRPAN